MKVSPLRQETEAGSGPAAAHKPAQEQASVMIEIDHVTQVFQTSARKDHLALLDISFSIKDGAFVSILGPSGCGKSTLLYIVGGFVSPTQGAAKMRSKAIIGPGVPVGIQTRTYR
jgi:NitT/TauT family transport system ATP-binding protein